MYYLKYNFKCHIILDFKITSVSDQKSSRVVGLAETASTIHEDREQCMEQDASVIDAEDPDYVSDLPHLDSSTRSPVSAPILREPPQFSSTTDTASDMTSPVPWHVKDCILKSITAIMDAATCSQNGSLIEIVSNFQSALRNELNINP